MNINKILDNMLFLISFFIILGCSSYKSSDASLSLNNSNNTLIARIYIDMWGGGAGGVDYIVNIQTISEKPVLNKNIVFQAQKEGKICIDWINNKTLKISTNINRYLKKKNINLDVKVVYSSLDEPSKVCLSPSFTQTKFDSAKAKTSRISIGKE